jgi:PHD/YefM family antitoxin component YafN of YafNO toxin-antitoxin module
VKTPARRVRVTNDRDLVAVVEAVRSDGAPRIVERDGEDIAVVVSPDEYESTANVPKSRRNKEKLMALAGAWRDVDTDRLVADIYRWRHKSPASPPVEL